MPDQSTQDLSATKAVSAELLAASDEDIRRIMEFADPLTLRGLLYHLTQDESLADITLGEGPGLAGVPVYYASDPAQVVPLRAKAVDLLIAYRDGKIELPSSVSIECFNTAMSMTVGEQVPMDNTNPWSQMDFWLEELALDPLVRRHRWSKQPDDEDFKEFERSGRVNWHRVCWGQCSHSAQACRVRVYGF